jgi:hypothetical protein
MPNVLSGFAIVSVNGDDVENVSIQGYIVNAHTNAFDLSVFGFTPEEVRAPSAKSGASLPCGRVFSVGHMLATPGATADTPFSFDTTMFFTYAAGLAGEPGGPGATVETYLFDDATGQLLARRDRHAGLQPVRHAAEPGRAEGRDDARRASCPAVPSSRRRCRAVCVVSGDAGNVTPQAFIVNRHTSAFDVSIFAPEFNELAAAAVSAAPGEVASRLGLRSFPNPFNPRTTFSYTLPAAGAVRVGVYDIDGNLVRTLVSASQDEGSHEVAWDGRADDGGRLPSGVYFGRIESSSATQTQKVTLVK